ncbi:hypothetical protein [Bradyrhizobium sp.]|uniref:hypothetical protein n=1 Tax=Bradyrhizobium sp. TaxID=376 RepID=UPI002E00250C|nr:hypothetical protein [Bradyrhizobium sp.]
MTARLNPLTIVAILVLALVLGLAVATLSVAPDQRAVPELSGSSTPPEFAGRTVDTLLGAGDFVTRAPDGDAFAQLRFASPRALARIVHTYLSEVWTQYRIRKAAIETSDDGQEWQVADRAEERDGKLSFQLGNAGAHRYWRMVVLESGAAPEVIFGNLRYVESTGILSKIPIDLAWLCLIPALILLFACLPAGVTPERLFVAVAVPVALFVSTYSFGYAGYHIVNYSDSYSYLQRLLTGGYSPIRNSGYASFLVVTSKLIGLDHLAWVQLAAIIACYFAGAWLLASYLGKRWLGPVLVLMFLLQGAATEFADQILTEALFTAGITLFAGSLGALAWRPGISALIAAMIGIAVATLAKSVGIVLVIPALLLIRFLPKRARWRFSIPIIAAGLLTYGTMAVNSYWRSGSFAPESFAGYALFGQVAWMLDDSFMPQSELTRALLDAALPVVRKRPAGLMEINSATALDRYVDYTVQEYNTLLWGTLAPVVSSRSLSVQEENAFYLQFALSSIRAHPAAYLRHVVAHFYALWRDMGNVEALRPATIRIRSEPPLAGPLELQIRNMIPASILEPYPHQAQLKAELAAQTLLPLAVLAVWDSTWIKPEHTIALGWVALGLSLLFLIPGRLAAVYRAETMIALSLNAYFGTHALLQVSTARYAWVASLAAFMLGASFVGTSFDILKTVVADKVQPLLASGRPKPERNP